jgi:hypothetical protein
MTYKLWKANGIYVEVSIDDIKEYYWWANGELETTRVLELLDNNVAEYEDLMNEYAMVIDRKELRENNPFLVAD